ncbi:hypothetical protein V5799_029228 [Amblyomma americanum]|uniref:Uncharacterized protein n=1 Tax=Amblyomma americanum TaxID=6943 RepID=A0AAQ4ERL8_AMBAM
MKESLQKEQSAQQEVAPLERAQSRSPPPGRGDGYESLSSVTEDVVSCCNLKPVGIESASSEAQVPANNVEIAGAELPDAAQSAIQVEREQRSLPAGLEMSPVEEKADKTHPVGDAREGMTDFCAEPHEHEEKGGSPGAGVQCELSLRIDMEASTETRQKFATHAKSRHDLGVPLPMQPEGLASSVKTLQQLSTQSMKASENMALSIVKARGLSALTANEGRKLDRQQRKRNVTALTACAAPIFGRRRRVRVFDPGGRR